MPLLEMHYAPLENLLNAIILHESRYPATNTKQSPEVTILLEAY
jgi:hypothetical protein